MRILQGVELPKDGLNEESKEIFTGRLYDGVAEQISEYIEPSNSVANVMSIELMVIKMETYNELVQVLQKVNSKELWFLDFKQRFANLIREV